VDNELADAKRYGVDGEKEQNRVIARLTAEIKQRGDDLTGMYRRVRELREQIQKVEEAKKLEDAAGARHGTKREAVIAVKEQRHTQLHAEVEVLTGSFREHTEKVYERYPDFSQSVPDAEMVHKEIAAADAAIHESHRQAVRLHADSHHLDNEVRHFDGGHNLRALELNRLADLLQSLAVPVDVEPTASSSISPTGTLVACLPDPCPVGHPLKLVVTTVNESGLPVAGASAEEISAQYITVSHAGGVTSLGSNVVISGVGEEGSSTFTGEVTATQAGRFGFKVTFRGAELTCSARVQEDAAVVDMSALTVHCTPHSSHPFSRLGVTVVLRHASLKPARGAALNWEPYTAPLNIRGTGLLDGAAVPPLRQLHEGVGVFTTNVELGPEVQPGYVDFAGVEVASTKDWVGATVYTGERLEPDSAVTTVCCSPDPVEPGGDVTYWIVPRTTGGQALNGAILEVPEVTPVQDAGDLQPPQWSVDHNAWTGRFTARDDGTEEHIARAGVKVNLGGSSVTKTVGVLPMQHCVPQNTRLRLTPDVISPGASITVSITTHDAKGRLAKGPEATAFRLTPLGGATKALPVYPMAAEGHYEARLQTAQGDAHASAGCSLDFAGFSSSARVRIVRSQSPPPAARAQAPLPVRDPRPPIALQWARDPVVPLEEALVTAVVPEGGGMPELHALDNCTVKTGLIQTGTHVWRGVVHVGPKTGSAKVAVHYGQKRVAAGVCVQGTRPEGDINDAAQRLYDTNALEDFCGETDELRQENDEKQARLDALEKELYERQQALELTVFNDDEPPAPFVLFGVLLSDGVTYGGEWQSSRGARVVMIRDDGPVALAEQVDSVAVRPGDEITEMQWIDESGAKSVRRVGQLADFRKVCRELGVRFPHGDPPAVTVSFTQKGRSYRIVAQTRRTVDPPGRSAGVRKHPAKTIQLSPPRLMARSGASVY